MLILILRKRIPIWLVNLFVVIYFLIFVLFLWMVYRKLIEMMKIFLFSLFLWQLSVASKLFSPFLRLSKQSLPFLRSLRLGGGFSTSYPPTNHEDSISQYNGNDGNFQKNVPLNETDSALVASLSQKYPSNRLVCIQHPHFPFCEFYLCGTLHVGNSSKKMVKDVISALKPQYVVIELCAGRIDGLLDQDDDDNELLDEAVSTDRDLSTMRKQQQKLIPLSLSHILKDALFHHKSLKKIGMDLLAWMQMKAAKMIGSKLGDELTTACKEAYKYNSVVILGDRLYSITMQRIFDKITFYEKCKFLFYLFYEIITMNLIKINDFIYQTENNNNFIEDELASFIRCLPHLASILVHERDEYLAQTLYEIGSVGFSPSFQKQYPLASSSSIESFDKTGKGKIVAVVGAGHLQGITKHLLNGPISEERLREISSSSKHPTMWPGKGVLQIIDLNHLYNHRIDIKK
jgi:pheromone shutdown protein TraB